MAKDPFAGIPALEQVAQLAHKEGLETRSLLHTYQSRTAPAHVSRKCMTVDKVLFFVISLRNVYYPHGKENPGYGRTGANPYSKKRESCQAVAFAIDVEYRGRRLVHTSFWTTEEFKKYFSKNIAVPLDKLGGPPWKKHANKQGLKRCLQKVKK